MRRSSGLTLLELMIALAVIGIVSVLAVPSFANLQSNSERADAVNGFLHAVFLARSESMKTGHVVSLCQSSDGTTCANQLTQWNRGWIVFVNRDRDEPPERDSQEPIVGSYAGWARGRITSNRVAYSFRPSTQGVVNGTVIFCDARGSREARALIINHAGRPRIAARDAEGRPLKC